MCDLQRNELLEQIRDNMKDLKLSTVSIENQKLSEFSLTNGVPKKDESGKMVWNENDLRNAKSVKESMDAVTVGVDTRARTYGVIDKGKDAKGAK